MPRVLVVCLVVLFAAVRPPHAAAAAAPIFDTFDPAPLSAPEKRLLQTALAASGDYRGGLDGAWGPLSRRALAAWAGRRFGADASGAARNAHVAALVLGFLDRIGQDGWDFSFQPDLGVSLALPLALLGPPEAEEGGQRRWTRDGSLTVLTQRFDAAGAARWHDAARRANTRADALVTQRAPDRMITSGVLGDGRAFYTRSDRTGDDWGTVYLAGGADQAGALNLAASSIRPGPPQPWDLPEGGRLSWLVNETEAFLEDSGAPPRPVGALPHGSGRPQDADSAISTGTAFYLGARTVVTAEHVVEGCSRVSLADGTDLRLVAADADLDVAALTTPAPARRWLTLAGSRIRLGQRVHAAGFPYYSIAGTSLNLTSGNVSALAGVDDDQRFFSFSAPVQPGNSGGPLIDARGAVLGLVVARLSEDYIVETTGSLPQNVNYALSEAELAAFLKRSGLATARGGLGGFDMDDGAPDGFEAAVVPIVCH